MSRDCRPFETSLAAGEETQGLRAHLATCPRCRSLAQDLAAWKAAAEALPRPALELRWRPDASTTPHARRRGWRLALASLSLACALGATALWLSSSPVRAPELPVEGAAAAAETIDLWNALALAEGVYRPEGEEVLPDGLSNDGTWSEPPSELALYEETRPEDLLPPAEKRRSNGR